MSATMLWLRQMGLALVSFVAAGAIISLAGWFVLTLVRGLVSGIPVVLTGFDVAETIVRSGPGQVVTLIAGLAVARLIYLATERRLTGRAEAAIRP